MTSSLTGTDHGKLAVVLSTRAADLTGVAGDACGKAGVAGITGVTGIKGQAAASLLMLAKAYIHACMHACIHT